jgi:hypothetical protein
LGSEVEDRDADGGWILTRPRPNGALRDKMATQVGDATSMTGASQDPFIGAQTTSASAESDGAVFLS